MTTSQTLIKARDLLQQGWCQGALFKQSKGKTRYCIVGAIHDVNQSHLMIRRCLRMVREAAGIEEWDVAAFNDAPGRKKSEILKLMDDAIELAKQEESKQ